MKLLFIHQNLPGQYKHLIRLAANAGHQVVGIGEAKNLHSRNFPDNIGIVSYATPEGAGKNTHHYVQAFEAAVRRGQLVLRTCLQLKKEGFYPDLICCHPGWGEALFLKDAFPDAKICCYFEFFYRAHGSDVGFDPMFPAALDDQLRIRIKNTTQMHALEIADIGVSPTKWQRQQFPEHWQNKIQVIHEGIDTNHIKPDSNAIFMLPNGQKITKNDEVITFVNRNLEPYRGFHTFMKALPLLLEKRPHTKVVMVGGDDVSYGQKPPKPFNSWREVLMTEIGMNHPCWQQVYFTGKISYENYLCLLQVSSLHVYLTYPFVLSWSMMEAMSAGCLILGSATPPVEELITDGSNGFLFPFFDHEQLATKAVKLLSAPTGKWQPQRAAARQSIIDQYDLNRIILPQYKKMLDL